MDDHQQAKTWISKEQRAGARLALQQVTRYIEHNKMTKKLVVKFLNFVIGLSPYQLEKFLYSEDLDIWLTPKNEFITKTKGENENGNNE